MNKKRIEAFYREGSDMLREQYPDVMDDLEEAAFNQGLADGFIMSLRGWLDQAFPVKTRT